MTQDQEQLAEIAAKLRSLVESSPHTDSAIGAWSVHAREVYRQIHIRYPHVRLPVIVLHYIHDADTRLRDPEYSAGQVRGMEALIRDLEAGVLPRGKGFSVKLPGGLVLSGCSHVFVVVGALVAIGVVFLTIRGGK